MRPEHPTPRPLIWVAGARAELKALPQPVRRTMGIALWFAQQRQGHPDAVGMKGPLAGVSELRVTATSGTYRLMYTARLGDTIYVLAAFQKKAHHGVATPRHVLERVTRRLATARMIHVERNRDEG